MSINKNYKKSYKRINVINISLEVKIEGRFEASGKKCINH